MRVLIAAVVCGLFEELRSSLPSTEEQAAHFLQGLCWGVVLSWLALILVTWQWAVTR